MLRLVRKIVRSNSFLSKCKERFVNRKRRIYRKHLRGLKGQSGLEIGGCSQVFSMDGPLPVYGLVSSVDNVNFSENTFWSSGKDGEEYRDRYGGLLGKQYISDATDLSLFRDSTYQFLLASHVIEHIANPIKALNEWSRVLEPGATIVVIAPEKSRTYDRKRPTTTFSHLVKDFEDDVSEDDCTHFEEVIELHDYSLDSTVKDGCAHKSRTLNNKNNRIVHHHVYDGALLKQVLRFCNFNVVSVQLFRPYHIVIVGKKE
jgi:predicted SAM-dependent methyltransferase